MKDLAFIHVKQRKADAIFFFFFFCTGRDRENAYPYEKLEHSAGWLHNYKDIYNEGSYVDRNAGCRDLRR